MNQTPPAAPPRDTVLMPSKAVESAQSGGLRDDDALAPRGWWTVIAMMLVSTFSFVDRGVLALFVQPMKRDFHLSDTAVSALLGLAFTLPYVLVGFPMARLVDRGSRRTLIACCLALWSLFTGVCGLAQGFWTLFVARAVIGGAESVNTAGSLSLIADAVPRRALPRAFALQSAGVTGGAALSLLLGGVLYRLLGDVAPLHIAGIGTVRNWQLVFLIVGLPGLLLAAVLMLTVPEPRRRGVARAGGHRLGEVAGQIRAQAAMHGPLLAGMLLLALVNNGLAAWTPAFFERTYGWGPATSGPLVGTMSLVTSLAGLVTGAHLAERLVRRGDDANLRVLWLAHLLALPFLAAAPLMPNPWLALALNALGGFFGVMGGPGFSAAIQLTTPNAMRAQVNVIYAASITALGGSFGPTLIGFLSDHAARSEADLRYVLVATRLAFAPVAVWLVWRSLAPYARFLREGECS